MALGSPKKKKTRGFSVAEKQGQSGKSRAVSDKHESATARAFGGSVQRASGATERHKGDVKTADLLIENKTREPSAKDGARSIRIQGKWLEKITGEARAIGKDPALAFQITGIKDPFTEQRWIAVPESVMARLIGEEGDE